MAPTPAVVLNVPFIGWSDERLPEGELNPSAFASAGMVATYWGLDLVDLEGEAPRLRGWVMDDRTGTSLKDLKPLIADGIPIEVSPNALTPFAHPINPIPYQMGMPLPDPHGHPSGLLSGVFVRLDTAGLASDGTDSVGRIYEDHWWSSRVVVGYDDRRGRVLLHDPTFGPYWEVSDADFDAMWQVGGRRYRVMHPSEYRDLVPDPDGPRAARIPQHEKAVQYVHGYALASLGRYEEAERYFRDGLAISGRTDGYRFLFLLELGGVRFRRGDVDGAIAFAEQASTALPEHPASWDLLGMLYATKFPGDPRRHPLGFLGSLFRVLVRPNGWERKSLRVGTMAGKADTPTARRVVRENLPSELLYAVPWA